jgi:hypothetical protein
MVLPITANSVYYFGDGCWASERFVEKHLANLPPMRHMKWIRCSFADEEAASSG